MAKIFLTGITGLVGGAFTVALLRERDDMEIVALARGNSVETAQQRVETILAKQCAFDECSDELPAILRKIKVIQGDVTDIDPVKLAEDPLLKGVEIIFHCAADVNLGKDVDGKTFNINYVGTQKVVELAKLLKVKEFHYVSTAYVAGKLVGRAMEDKAVDSGFNNPYEESKFKAELLVREAGIPYSIYRPSIITGRVKDGRIRRPLAFYRILEFLLKLKKNQCFKQKLDPHNWIDINAHFNAVPSERVYFVPIDYVQKVITALFQKPVVNKTYHVTGDKPVSTSMIDHAVCRTLRLEGIEVERREKNPGDDVITRFLGDLLPYFASDIVFDQTNVKEALGDEKFECELGEKGLEVMMRSFFLDFFPDVKWIQEIIEEDGKTAQ